MKATKEDLFDFDQEKVMPYFEPVKILIDLVEKMLTI